MQHRQILNIEFLVYNDISCAKRNKNAILTFHHHEVVCSRSYHEQLHLKGPKELKKSKFADNKNKRSDKISVQVKEDIPFPLSTQLV